MVEQPAVNRLVVGSSPTSGVLIFHTEKAESLQTGIPLFLYVLYKILTIIHEVPETRLSLVNQL